MRRDKDDGRSFRATRRTVRGTMRVPAPPERVFPLLCPTREYDWIGDWDCDLLYSESGLAEPDCVFVTSGEGGERIIWTVSRYEPPRRIEFVLFHPSHVLRYVIELEDDASGGSTLTWSQTLTGLTEEGNRGLGRDYEETFLRLVKTLERMLVHYLSTGEALREPSR